MKYVTKNKLQILDYIKSHKDEHLTIEQIYQGLNKKIPIASLYRIVDSLVEDGQIRKFITDINVPACFQYIGDNNEHMHFHLLCTECGKLIHLECDEVNHLVSHIQDEHDFQIDITKVNLYGLCADCLRKKQNA